MYYAVVAVQDHCTKSEALEKILDSIMLKNSFPFKYMDISETLFETAPTIAIYEGQVLVEALVCKKHPDPQAIKQFFKPYL